MAFFSKGLLTSNESGSESKKYQKHISGSESFHRVARWCEGCEEVGMDEKDEPKKLKQVVQRYRTKILEQKPKINHYSDSSEPPIKGNQI